MRARVTRANINKGPTSDISTSDGFLERTNYRQSYYTSSNNLIRISFLLQWHVITNVWDVTTFLSNEPITRKKIPI